MKLFLFTTDVSFAQQSAAGGVYSIVVDWEREDKGDVLRSGKPASKTDTPADVRRLKAALKIPITVRVNGLHKGTAKEVDAALKAGADIIMQPMARSSAEVHAFLKIVDKRAKTLVQIETQELIGDIAEFATLGWDFTYIGLNDLKISRGSDNIWEAVADGTVEKICTALAGRQYGFGGATVIDGGRPLRFDLLVHEYTRLRCSLSFMRRTFAREVSGRDVAKEVKAIQRLVRASMARSTNVISRNRVELAHKLSLFRRKLIVVMYSTHDPSTAHIQRLKRMAEEYGVVVVRSEEEALTYAPKAHVIFGHHYLRQSLPTAQNLKWVQSTAGGVDKLPLRGLKKGKVMLTRWSGGAPSVAKHAVKLLRALQKRTKRQHKTVLILGFGSIGQEIAKRLKKTHIIWGVKRDKDIQAAKLSNILFTDASWKKVLSKVDAVIVSIPHTPTTVNVLNVLLLKKLPKHTLVINVSRAETIDEKYVVAMVRHKKLGGYATDVRGASLTDDVVQELAAKKLPVVVTEHVGAIYPERPRDIEAFVEKQLKKYLLDQELEHLVDYKNV